MADGAAQRLTAMQAALAQDSQAFWLNEATQRLDWSKAPTRADESSFHAADFGVRWFADGELNLSVNCLDRHLASRRRDLSVGWRGGAAVFRPHAIPGCARAAERPLELQCGCDARLLADTLAVVVIA